MSFTNPTTRKKEVATIIDEIWFPEPESFSDIVPDTDEGWLQTAFVAQLVNWEAGRRIRITYYTRRDTAWGWVFGQYSASLAPQDLGYLMGEMKSRGWLNED